VHLGAYSCASSVHMANTQDGLRATASTHRKPPARYGCAHWTRSIPKGGSTFQIHLSGTLTVFQFASPVPETGHGFQEWIRAVDSFWSGSAPERRLPSGPVHQSREIHRTTAQAPLGFARQCRGGLPQVARKRQRTQHGCPRPGSAMPVLVLS